MAVVVVPSGLITTHVAVERQVASLERNAARNAEGLLELVDSSVTNLVHDGDLSALHEVLTDVRRHRGVLETYVVSATGDLLADGTSQEARRFSRPGLPHDLDEMLETSSTAVHRTHGDHLEGALPLFVGDQRIGAMFLRYSLAEVRAEAAAARRAGTVVDLLVTMLAVTAVILLAVRLTRALVRLTEAARRATAQDLPRILDKVAKGQAVSSELLPPPVVPRGGREAAGLADALNTYRDVVISMATDLARLLREREAQFRTAFDGSAVGMSMIDPASGTQLNVNEALCRILSRSRHDLLSTSLRAVVHPDDRDRYDAHLDDLLRGTSGSSALELRFVLPQGGLLWTVASVAAHRNEDGAVEMVFVQLVDVTARKQAEVDLRHLAFEDPVTGLPNRRYLADCLEEALARPTSADRTTAVLLLDIDHFKVVNDSLGHDAGDVLLREVGTRLRAAMRAGDSVVRFGGDEFVVVAERVRSDEEALAVATRIEAALRPPVRIGGRDVHVSASIGIAVFRGQGDASSLLRDADTAAYWAKSRGRNRHELFDDALRDRAQDRMQVEQDLREALERDELVAHYQPIVATSTGHVLGLEALVRWNHPRRGLLSPAAFLDVAVETNLITKIGQRVLEQVVQDLAAWDATSHHVPWVAVNIDAQQLHLDTFPDDVSRLLHETGTAPCRIHLELTENAFLDTSSVEMTKRLRALGVGLAIDDFGTGYSSLHYLRTLQVDTLKIDRSFLEDVCLDDHASAVVSAIIDLSHAVQLTVVAEGVETPEQLSALTRLGCDAYQGYLHSRPLAAGAVPAFFAAPALTVG